MREVSENLPDHTFGIIGAKSSLEGPNIHNYTLGPRRNREEFEKILDSFDALVFFYLRTGYKLMASGAIFDAIELGIPIIAVRNDYFEHLFRLHGPLGYLYDDLPSMLADLPNLLQHDHSDVARNLVAAREYHSPEMLATIFRKKLAEILT